MEGCPKNKCSLLPKQLVSMRGSQNLAGNRKLVLAPFLCVAGAFWLVKRAENGRPKCSHSRRHCLSKSLGRLQRAVSFWFQGGFLAFGTRDQPKDSGKVERDNQRTLEPRTKHPGRGLRGAGYVRRQLRRQSSAPTLRDRTAGF